MNTTMEQPKHPFNVGARVALSLGNFGPCHSYREDFVAKLYKSGRFTMRSDPNGQQWRSYREADREGIWQAFQTGGGWNRITCLLWDAAADRTIQQAIATESRTNRIFELRRRLERIGAGDITTERLTAIENILKEQSV